MSGMLLAVAGGVALVLVDWRRWLAQSTSGGRRWQAESKLALGEIGPGAGRLAACGVGRSEYGGGLCRTRCWSIGGLACAEHLRSSGGRWRASSELGLGCVAPCAGRLAALAAQRIWFGGVRWQAVSQLTLGEVRPGACDRRP